jgi:integrase
MKTPKKTPNKTLVNKVQEFIGYPPKAVLFSMIKIEFSKETTKSLEKVMDYLWEKQLIDVWENGWINGKRPAEKVNLTKDDIDWFFGIGRYRQ